MSILDDMIAAAEAHVKDREDAAFQRGVEHGALEQRVAARSKEDYADVRGVGRQWAEKRAAELTDEFVAKINQMGESADVIVEDVIKVELRKLLLRAMCFDSSEGGA